MKQSNGTKTKTKTILIVVFIILILYGTFIRFYGLGEKSFWIDESISALAAKKIVEKGIPVFDSGLFYSRSLIFHYLMAGFLLFGQNEFNARIISVIFGILTCVLIYFIASEYNKKAGWIAFVFSLFLEIFVEYSRQARMYQMEMFFFFLTLFLLYKSIKERKYLWWAIGAFLLAYDTHTIAVLLVPAFFYVFFKNKMNKWAYIALALISLFFVFRAWSLLSSFNFFYLWQYILYLKYYVPFLIVGIIGAIITYKKQLTWFLGASFFFILIAGGLNQLFAFRYIYLAFLPLLVLSAYSLSKIKFSWAITIAYLLLISFPIFSTSTLAVIIPQKTLSFYDFTAPEADFRGIYTGLETNKTFIATFTPAAEWYYKKPNYWVYFSFSGLSRMANETFTLVNGAEVYTGAKIIFNDTSLVNGIVVADDWSFARISPNIANFIKNNCTLTRKGEGISAYDCK